jgi:RimJ/RimL family protein N-acetyltransferase
MRHDIQASGMGHRLRPVELSDARFIVEARASGERTRYLHRVPFDEDRQRAWLERYFERKGDYYFVIERLADSEPVGLVGIYEVDGDQAEWGRWVVLPDSVAAIPSAILVYDTAFETLGLRRCYCRTVAENRRVVSFHDSFGARRCGDLAGAFDLDGVVVDAVGHEILAEEWPEIRTRVAPLGERLVSRARPS